MSALLDTIKAVATKARKYRDRRLGEQNTKVSLIEPILHCNQRTLLRVACLVVVLPRVAASAGEVVIDGSTLGLYNDSILGTLNGTDPNGLFPISGDPTFDPAPEPDWSAAARILGEWLEAPTMLNENWTEQSIPPTWAIGTETAIVYPFMVEEQLCAQTVLIGVDNGAFVWIDGEYVGGAMHVGGVFLGEITIETCDLPPGEHYLQILREDHGGQTGFAIEVSAVSATCPQDTNCDGFVDVGDLIEIILAWGTGDCGADVDQSGIVDVVDLVTVVLAWYACG